MKRFRYKIFLLFSFVLALHVDSSRSFARTCLTTHEVLKALTAEDPAAFHDRHAEFTGITTADNIHFDEVSTHDHSGKHLYLNVEFSILKLANDEMFASKTFSNAIGNAYKKNVLEFLESIEMNPRLSGKFDVLGIEKARSVMTAKYSDFKAVRIQFTKGDPELENILKDLSQKAAKRYQSDIEALGISDIYRHRLGIAAQPLTWHLAGIGDNVAEARTSAIFSEQFNQNHPHELHVSVFRDIVPALTKSIQYMDEVSKRLAENPAILKSKMLIPGKTRGTYLISSNAQTLIKDSETPEIFQEKVAAVFHVKLSESEAVQMTNWYHTADSQFSPGIVQLERVSVHAVHAPYGVIAIDYRALSNRKLLATMEGIAEAVDHDPRKALVAIDKHFALDHERLLAQHKRIAEKFSKNAKYIFSGDELFIIPDHVLSDKEKAAFVAEIAKDPEANHIRTGFSTIQNTAERSRMIAQGDKLETATRKSLFGITPIDQLVQVNMGMDIVPIAGGKFAIQPIVSGAGLNPEARLALENAMRKNGPIYAQGMEVWPVKFIEPAARDLTHAKTAIRAARALVFPAQQGRSDRKPGADASQ